MLKWDNNELREGLVRMVFINQHTKVMHVLICREGEEAAAQARLGFQQVDSIDAVSMLGALEYLVETGHKEIAEAMNASGLSWAKS